MSRWLRNVGDFLEKLDTGDEVEDDVLAARDFAKELKEQTLEDEEEGEGIVLDPSPVDSGEDMYAGGEQVETEIAEEPEPASMDDPTPMECPASDFQTPQRSASVENESIAAATNLKQYRTPAQFDEEEADYIAASRDEIKDDLESERDNESKHEGNAAQQPAAAPAINERILEEVQLLKSKLKTMETKHRAMETEKGEINQEARKLRKHMVTLNEQLEAADKELDAQRKELLQAAESLEANRKLNTTTVAELKSKNATLVKEMEQQHAAAIAALKQQHVQQQDDLRQELLLMNNQNQQHTGSLGKRLEQLEDENSKLAIERNDLLGQTRQLQSQYEDLSSTLEDLQDRADQYSIKETEYEDTVEQQRAQIEQLTKQRNKDVQNLEDQVASLTMALISTRKTPSVPAAKETTSSSDSNAGLAADCEYWKGEHAVLKGVLEQEREQLEESRQELLTYQSEKQAEMEHLKREHAAAVVELRQRIQSLERQSVESKNSTDTEHQHKALSNQILRQQEQLSQANVEMSALRTRLSAALNRATVAEAAAEDTREPIRVSSFPRRRKAQTVSIKQALGGTGGTSVDFLDSFLAAASKILRSNPYARLVFVLYLAVLHLWTFALLVFHAHASTSAIDPSHGPQSVVQASLRTNGP